MAKVLVVDDDAAIVHGITRALTRGGCDVVSAHDGPRALQLLARDPEIEVLLIDLILPGASGLDVLRDARAHRPDLPVIMMTGSASIESAVEALKAGAFDYLTKPFVNLDIVLLSVERAARNHRLLEQNTSLRKQLEEKEGFEDLVGGSPRMRALFDVIRAVSSTPATALIRGESGTGKELVARAIHRRSDRADKPFHAINCSALAEGVLDGELFGHVKGSFTGALASRKGLFEAANGGTVFLDEIGDISPTTQVRLLRVLQEGEVKPIGANEATYVDVRVIAATHIDLEEAIKKRQFREDLFYRLNVVSLEVPALRERREDIEVLAHHFLRKHAQRMKRVVTGFSEAALQTLLSYDWPGNVRELENAVARGVVLCTAGVIEPVHLPATVAGSSSRSAIAAPSSSYDELPYAQAKKAALTAFERAYLGAKLKAAHGNVSKAARAAGMDRSNFKRLLREYGIAGPLASMEGEPLDS
jgi:DNA-binding NtrC family response regulator